MKHKVSELEGALLDAAVALIEAWIQPEHLAPHFGIDGKPVPAPALRHMPRASREWAHGGPIIERERISINFDTEDYTTPEAPWYAECRVFWDIGPTPLIAAMRCYVASKLGEEIELP